MTKKHLKEGIRIGEVEASWWDPSISQRGTN
jgi:hypothetical protein